MTTKSVEAPNGTVKRRKPAVKGLGLENAGVETNKQKAVVVNDRLQTSQPHIFAAGDVTGLYEIVHIAIQQAEIATRNAKSHLEGKVQVAIDYRLKMFIMFTEPQMAVVGRTEREAAEQGLDVRVARHPFADHGKSIVRGELDGFVKLIVDAKTGETLWVFKATESWKASPMTYMVNGREYVAIASGGNILSFALANR